MSNIYVRRSHDLSYDEAHALMDNVADEMADKLGISYQKNGDTLTFRRSGASGSIQLTETEIIIEAKLGLMLRMMKPSLELAIHATLDQYI